MVTPPRAARHNKRRVPFLGALLTTLLAVALLPRALRRRRPAQTLIVSPTESTVVAGDGAVRSVQSALLTMPRAELQRLWSRDNLENLGRTYWRFLSLATFGLVRVRYTKSERSVILLFPPITLLRFGAPEYEIEPERGRIRWPIKGGILVSRHGRGTGHLALEVQREDASADPVTVLVEVEVNNFYPALASRLGFDCYQATQAFVHVRVTHAFLRSLARLELAESHVRRFPTA
jgi:hypothetical protein